MAVKQFESKLDAPASRLKLDVLLLLLSHHWICLQEYNEMQILF